MNQLSSKISDAVALTNILHTHRNDNSLLCAITWWMEKSARDEPSGSQQATRFTCWFGVCMFVWAGWLRIWEIPCGAHGKKRKCVRRQILWYWWLWVVSNRGNECHQMAKVLKVESIGNALCGASDYFCRSFPQNFALRLYLQTGHRSRTNTCNTNNEHEKCRRKRESADEVEERIEKIVGPKATGRGSEYKIFSFGKFMKIGLAVCKCEINFNNYTKQLSCLRKCSLRATFPHLLVPFSSPPRRRTRSGRLSWAQAFVSRALSHASWWYHAGFDDVL